MQVVGVFVMGEGLRSLVAVVDPIDGHPLVLHLQGVDRPNQRVEGLVVVAVDDRQVKVLFVLTLNAGTVIDRHLQVFVLVKLGQTLHCTCTPRAANGTVKLRK